MWFVFWDPTQSTATRPLAIQKDGTWFVCGHDLTKNVCEVFGPAGYIRTEYSYSPFGNVTAVGDLEQPFQWSSEFYDSELDLAYYNFRHYSPTLGRWLSRDPIAEQGGLNLYAFVGNNGVLNFDLLGNDSKNDLDDVDKDNEQSEASCRVACGLVASGKTILATTIFALENLNCLKKMWKFIFCMISAREDFAGRLKNIKKEFDKCREKCKVKSKKCCKN